MVKGALGGRIAHYSQLKTLQGERGYWRRFDGRLAFSRTTSSDSQGRRTGFMILAQRGSATRRHCTCIMTELTLG